jgi:hypothetical protein
MTRKPCSGCARSRRMIATSAEALSDVERATLAGIDHRFGPQPGRPKNLERGGRWDMSRFGAPRHRGMFGLLVCATCPTDRLRSGSQLVHHALGAELAGALERDRFRAPPAPRSLLETLPAAALCPKTTKLRRFVNSVYRDAAQHYERVHPHTRAVTTEQPNTSLSPEKREVEKLTAEQKKQGPITHRCPLRANSTPGGPILCRPGN